MDYIEFLENEINENSSIEEIVNTFEKMCEEEYCQIHVDVLFEPDDVNKEFSGPVWNEDLEENIFDYIRNSKAFEYARCNAFKELKIYLDET